MADSAPHAYDGALRCVDLRIGAEPFARLRAHVEDYAAGEQAGFLICAGAQLAQRRLTLAREFHPVPEDQVTGRRGAYGLSWSAEFNAAMIERADQLGGSLVLVHSHGGRESEPRLSRPDRRNAAQLFPAISSLLPGRAHGSVVLGADAASGHFWADGRPCGSLGRIEIVSDQCSWWEPSASRAMRTRRRFDRQMLALGAASEHHLASARVAVIGASGGGSHTCQQLAHAGFGSLTVVDDQLVEDVQLSRMVGALERDIDRTFKVEAMERLILGIDSSVNVEPVRSRFPAPDAIAAMKEADLIIACVDSFSARAAINRFARRYLIPLIDIGLTIETRDGKLVRADGQVVFTHPDSPCLQCTPLLSDAVLERERRERPPGYDRSNAPGDPQVVSLNGVLASEACNLALDYFTGYAHGRRGAGWWAYDGRAGSLERLALPGRRPGCPGCAEGALGDPAGVEAQQTEASALSRSVR